MKRWRADRAFPPGRLKGMRIFAPSFENCFQVALTSWYPTFHDKRAFGATYKLAYESKADAIRSCSALGI